MLATHAKWVTPAALVVVGIIHLLPLGGVAGSARLEALYGTGGLDTNLVILLRHRAVLFGLLGAFLLYCAFRPALQPLALLAGFLSIASFLWLALSTGGYNVQLARVVRADVVALLCLFAGAVAYVIRERA